MSGLRFAANVLYAFGRAAAHRASGRPFDRPSWTLREQALRDLMRAQMAEMDRMDIPAQRALGEGMQAPLLLRRKVACDTVDAGGVAARWFVPHDVIEGPVVLYLHGGGYVICSTRTHEELITRIALAARARVLAIEYRLAPEHPFPAAIEDATAAYRWLLADHVAPERIAIAGDSAGGGLTLATLLALRDAGDRLPAAGVPISPWVDLQRKRASVQANMQYDYLSTKDGDQWVNAYLGDTPPDHPLASPINADLGGLPPLLVQVGGAELLRDEGVELAERARAAGVDVTLEVWEDMVHVWHLFASAMPDARAAIRSIGRFVRARTVATGTGRG